MFPYGTTEGKPHAQRAMRGRAAILALLVLSAMELLVRALPASLVENPASIAATIEYVEKVLVPQVSDPRIVVLGSSRSAFGISPALLDERLGYGRPATLNLSLPGGGGYAAAWIYGRQRPLIRRASVVVYSVDEFFLGSVSTDFLERAPLLTRVRAAQAGHRMENVLDWLFRYRVRLPWLFFRFGVALGLRERLPAFDFAAGNDRGLTREGAVPTSWTQAADFDPVIEDYYGRYRLRPEAIELVSQPARWAQEDGVRFVYLQMPYHPLHAAEVRRLHGDTYAAHVRMIRELAERYQATFCDLADASACGLRETDFSDGVHLTDHGARRFTRCLAERLR